MFKDKQRIVILAAIVILFFVLGDGGFDFRLGGHHWLSQRTWTMVGLMALAWWFLSGGGRGCCGCRGGNHETDEDESDSEPDTGSA